MSADRRSPRPRRSGRTGRGSGAGHGGGRGRLALGLLARSLAAFAVIAVVCHLVGRPFAVSSGSMEPTLGAGDRVWVRVLGVERATVPPGTVVAFGHGRTWAEERLPDSGSPLVETLRTVGDLLGIGPSHEAHTVKRVIATPGQRVRCCDAQGRVVVEDQAVIEPWVSADLPFQPGRTDCASRPGGEGRSARCFPEITVPEGHYLVLGDNRAGSDDSVFACRGRDQAQGCARFVPADQITGVVTWRLWPAPGPLGG